jgi:hypothetical protein
MFLYNIAYSLEFVVVALGAFLIGWGRYKCYKNKMYCETTRTNQLTGSNVTGSNVVGTDVHKKCSSNVCGTGFAQAIGWILIILSVLNFVDTLYNSVKFHHHRNEFRQRMEMMRPNQTNPGVSNNTNANQPASQNSGY